MGCLKLLMWPISLPLLLLSMTISFARMVAIFFLKYVLDIEIVVNEIPRLVYVTHNFNKNPKDGVLLEIEGRYGNFLMNLLMKLIGINNRSYIRVTDKEIRVTHTGVFNTEHHVIPHSAVTTSYYQYTKRFRLVLVAAALVLGSIFFSAGNIILIIIAAVIAAAMVAVYAMSREFFVGFSTDDIDSVAGLSFSPGLLFGMGGNLPYEELKDIFEHINRNIIKAHQL